MVSLSTEKAKRRQSSLGLGSQTAQTESQALQSYYTPMSGPKNNGPLAHFAGKANSMLYSGPQAYPNSKNAAGGSESYRGLGAGSTASLKALPD